MSGLNLTQKRMPLDVWTVGFSGHSDVHSRELPLDVQTVGFSGHSDVHSRELPFDLFQAIQMFVARFCDLLDVEITCDGCGVTLPGRRYRCVQCVDMDLCTTCYSGKLVFFL